MKNELICKTDNDTMNRVATKNEIDVRKGDIFTSENERLRVIDVRELGIMVIDLNTNKVRLETCNNFFLLIEEGNLEKEKTESAVHMLLSVEEVKEIKERQMILEEMLQELYPRWDKLFSRNIPKNCYEKLMFKLKFTRKHLRSMLLIYLRSGRDMFSLADKRKFNQRPIAKPVVADDPRKNTQLLYGFALAEFKRTGSVQTAYDNLLRHYFRTEIIENGAVKMVLVPKEEITVSYKQVRSYIGKNLGGLTIKQYKNGERYVLNNDRLLPGDVRYGLSRLGQRYEVDECELPCYVVNPHTGESTGKPILYIVADEFAGIITGCYVSYDNNSCNGIRQAMLSMLEPHKYQTDKYKLTYTEDVFPSMCMPKEIRCDHGAEYESKNLERAFGEMGIDLSLVPVGCGSMKGLVEGIHNQIQILLKNHARNEGVIRDEYRGGDKAKGEACMTLEDIRKIVYSTILYINQRVISEYSLDSEQLAAGLVPTPANIYEFERKRSGDPRNVTEANRDRYMFALLAKQGDHRKFSIGREGIKYVGHPLYFFSEEPWFKDMIQDKKKKDKIEVRYDEINIGCVYVCYKGIIRKVPLSAKRESQLTYMGTDWFSYDKRYKEFKNSDKLKQAQEDSLNRKLQLQDMIEDVAGTARALHGPSTKYGKAPKEARAAEKQALREDPNEIINRMYASVDNTAVSDSVEKKVIEEKETVPVVPTRIPDKVPLFKDSREQARYLVELLGLEDD